MPGTIFQLSTIGALLQGGYHGTMTYSEIKEYGDFGLGTFDCLDGEMVAVDGNFYQIRSATDLKPADMNNKAPFAVVKFFQKEHEFTMSSEQEVLTWSALQRLLLAHIPNKNAFTAIKLEGTFDSIKVRTVPRQEEPFVAMTEIVGSQPEFELVDQSGVLAGFYFPTYSSQICVPEFHLHFVDQERTTGGHLLDCRLKSGTVEMDYSNEFKLHLPTAEWFATSTLDRDHREALAQVEGGGR